MVYSRRAFLNDSQGLRPDRLSQVIDLPTLNSVIDVVRTTKVQPQKPAEKK